MTKIKERNLVMKTDSPVEVPEIPEVPFVGDGQEENSFKNRVQTFQKELDTLIKKTGVGIQALISPTGPELSLIDIKKNESA